MNLLRAVVRSLDAVKSYPKVINVLCENFLFCHFIRSNLLR